MDDDAFRLTINLCTRIGIVMEDTSGVALTIAGMDDAGRTIALAKIEKASQQIEAFVGAVRALNPSSDPA